MVKCINEHIKDEAISTASSFCIDKLYIIPVK